MGKTCYSKHGNNQNLWMNNKVRGDKNAICLHFLPYLLNICRKFEFSIPQGSVATCLRWGGNYRISFVVNFICFTALQKFENRLRSDKVTESLKLGTFLRHSVYRVAQNKIPHRRICNIPQPVIWFLKFLKLLNPDTSLNLRDVSGLSSFKNC